MSETNHDNRAARFLLGKLGEEENAGIEKSYFGDQNLFQEILIAENDLIDAYVMNALSPEDKTRFENRFLLNPQQRRRIEFAKTLVEYASSQPLFEEEIKSPADKRSWISAIRRLFSNKPMLSLSFATAALMLFAAALWFVLDKPNPKSVKPVEVAENKTSQPTAAPDFTKKNSDENIEPKIVAKPSPQKSVQTPTAKQEQPQKQAPSVIYSLILSPGLTRDAGTSPRFAIPARTDFVKMRLKFEQSGFLVYHAVLETVEGRQIWSSNKLKARNDAKSLEVTIPAKLLKKADYILSLKGVTKDGVSEPVEDYTFTITREDL
jgi:hypothetical protein